MKSQIIAVRKMQDYIEEHYDEKITGEDLARVSNYSIWHSNRIFEYWLNLTPSDYIRRLRLSKAALKLRDEKVRIIDVAYEMGFNSVDGFQRAFSKEFGCNPKEYAMSPSPIYLFTPYGIMLENEGDSKMMNGKKVSTSIVVRPKRKVIIKRGKKATHYFEYCEEVGCEVWGLLSSIKSITLEPFVCGSLINTLLREHLNMFRVLKLHLTMKK